MALVCGEILLQPDFGTFMVFVAILFGVLLVSGVQLRWLLVLALIGVVGTVGMFKLNVLREYQKERLTAFIDPSADDGGRGFTYNSRQALIAIGSGGGHRQGLPARHPDQPPVRARAEDRLHLHRHRRGAGLHRAMGLLACSGLLLWRGLRIAAVARDPFGALLAAGVVTMLAFQAFVNIGMTIGIMPITGIPLPFVSYGGRPWWRRSWPSACWRTSTCAGSCRLPAGAGRHLCWSLSVLADSLSVLRHANRWCGPTAFSAPPLFPGHLMASGHEPWCRACPEGVPVRDRGRPIGGGGAAALSSAEGLRSPATAAVRA
jgi:hypothetical protein